MIINIAIRYLFLVLLLMCEAEFAMSKEVATSYEKYQERIRAEDYEGAFAWISRAALEGDSKAILEISSKCLSGILDCKETSLIEKLTLALTHSADVNIKGYACLLISKFELKRNPDTKGMLRALDYLLLADAYGEEGALSQALPVLKSVSEKGPAYAYVSLSIVNKMLLSTKKESILFGKLNLLKAEIEGVAKNEK